MKENPANAIKDTMWHFLMDRGQKANISALKEYVYDLIQMATQKDAGQRQAKNRIPWQELDMTLMSIVIEATALVLSGEMDRLNQNHVNLNKKTLDAVKILDEVIPPAKNKMVDLEHLPIALAWETIRNHLLPTEEMA